jgi:anti-anti-sigma factor
MQHGAEPEPGLVVSSLERDGVIIVNAGGELDYRSASALRSGLASAWGTPGVSALVLDLTGVAFCDSVGLSELIGALRHSRDTGVPLRVTGVQGTLQRVLMITGLHASFDIYDTVDTALGLPGATGGHDPGSAFPTPGDAFPTPGSVIPEPGDVIPAPGSAFPTPGSTTPEPGDAFPTPGSAFPTPGDTFPAPGGVFPTPEDAERHPQTEAPPAGAEWRTLPPDPGDLLPAT